GEDHEAAAGLADAAFNRSFLDPLFGRGYPEPVATLVSELVRDGDLEEIGRGMDVLGGNYYTPLRVVADPASPRGASRAGASRGAEGTARGGEVDPRGLEETLRRLRDEYGGPRVVGTECGAAFPAEPGPGGRVEDERRASFGVEHLRA